MQQSRQKKTEPELQLWEITAPKRKPAQRQPRAGRPVQSIRRRKAKKRRAILIRCLVLTLFLLFLAGIFQLTGLIYRSIHSGKHDDAASVWQKVLPVQSDTANPIEKPLFTVDLLEVNNYSRPGTKLKKVKNIFVHYTANPGTSAKQNKSYFANLAETGERSASAHFIIGYEGEILQCIPLEEQAYAVKGRNNDSVSIECCYLDADGAFTQSTRDSLIDLLAWLCGEYGLTEQDILRHYDAGGKKCPLYYVEHEDEWEQLIKDVGAVLQDASH